MPRVRLEHLVKSYGRVRAVDDLCLEVEDREFFVLYGPSGAGKTTTLKLIAGAEHPDSGEVHIGDRRVDLLEPDARNVAMTFESYSLYPHYSVYDNIAFPLRAPGRRMSRAEIDERVRWAARLLGIEHVLGHKPAEISQGQKQRTALARAIVRPADVYLFDEPLSHVDAKVRHYMRGELHRMSTMLNNTIIYVTHDYVEALSLGDRVGVLDHGRLHQVGTPREVYYAPRDLFVALSFGQPEMNILEGTLTAAGGRLRVETALGTTHQLATGEPLPTAGTEVWVGLRPQDLQLGDLGAGTAFEAEVLVFEPLGTHGVLRARANGQVLNVLVPPNASFEPGSRVLLDYPEDALYLFDRESQLNILHPRITTPQGARDGGAKA